MLSCLDSLISGLNTLTKTAELERLERALLAGSPTFSKLTPQCEFSEVNYKRQKLAGSEWYDLWLICWQAGQSSPIHDHQGSNCAFRIMTGVATEHVYEPITADTVREIGVNTYQSGELCVAAGGDIHRIANAETVQPLVTLHLYSPPLRMNYYREALS
ncbi:MAG: cysteine dioxygenase family protein [Myxococcota bacterium]